MAYTVSKGFGKIYKFKNRQKAFAWSRKMNKAPGKYSGYWGVYKNGKDISNERAGGRSIYNLINR